MSVPTSSTPFRVGFSRMLNFLLWISFSFMTGTGLLLAFRLPPGSRGGHKLEAMGWSRHEWGDFHTWIGYVFITLILLHLGLHWRWLWQVAARKRSWPILIGLSMGVILIFWLIFQPVTKG